MSKFFPVLVSVILFMIVAAATFAQTLVPGTANTWTDGIHTWAGSSSCNQIIDPYIQGGCGSNNQGITALLCPDSPAIDFGAWIENFYCPVSGSALNQPLQPDGSYCVEWYGLAPDAGACEFVSLDVVPSPILAAPSNLVITIQ